MKNNDDLFGKCIHGNRLTGDGQDCMECNSGNIYTPTEEELKKIKLAFGKTNAEKYGNNDLVYFIEHKVTRKWVNKDPFKPDTHDPLEAMQFSTKQDAENHILNQQYFVTEHQWSITLP